MSALLVERGVTSRWERLELEIEEVEAWTAVRW